LSPENNQTMASEPEPKAETLAVAERYARRNSGSLYSVLRPEVVLSTQEWQRKMLFLFGSVCGYTDVDLRRLKLVDVGCGYGGHLLDFLRVGFAPQNLYGIELLPERVAGARPRLPELLKLHEGDASTAALAPASQDVVFQSVVFSSLLDDAFQQELADRMWSWVRPGGGILWYDFVYNNPSNRDVRAVPVRRVKELFPHGDMTVRRVTLAPPISRRVCRIHPAAYGVFNALPFLRTHALCWIRKP
jgi:SAM-dependent methyltransferase